MELVAVVVPSALSVCALVLSLVAERRTRTASRTAAVVVRRTADGYLEVANDGPATATGLLVALTWHGTAPFVAVPTAGDEVTGENSVWLRNERLAPGGTLRRHLTPSFGGPARLLAIATWSDGTRRNTVEGFDIDLV